MLPNTKNPPKGTLSLLTVVGVPVVAILPSPLVKTGTVGLATGAVTGLTALVALL